MPADELARKATGKAWRKRLNLGGTKDKLRPQLSDVSQAIEAAVAQLVDVDPDLKEVMISVIMIFIFRSVRVEGSVFAVDNTLTRVRAWNFVSADLYRFEKLCRASAWN